MRAFWIFILIVIACVKGYAQEYEFNASYDFEFTGTAFVTDSLFEITGGFGTISNKSGVFQIYSIPTNVNVELEIYYEDYNTDRWETCYEYWDMNLGSTTTCYDDENLSNSSCALGSPRYDIYYSLKPLIQMETGTTENTGTNNPYCTTNQISMVASPGFGSYTFQYRTATGTWQTFNSGISNTVSFTIEEVLGGQTNDHLNETIFFRYNVGNCTDWTIAPIREYVFSIEPPEVVDISITSPSCTADNDGGLNIPVLDRSLVMGEDIIYDLFEEGSQNVPGNSTGEFLNLGSGNYSMAIQSNTMIYCANRSFYPIEIVDPTEVQFTTSNITPVVCFGTTTGSITVNPSGGTGDSYTFSTDGLNFDNNSIISNLPAGENTIYVRDGNNCDVSGQVNIEGPSAALDAIINITSDYNGSELTCISSSDAEVEIIASNGWGNYQFSTTETGTYSVTNSFSDLPAGSHTFWIKDDKECIISKSIDITPPADLLINDISVTAPSCPNDNGLITVNASGGTGIISYSIDNINYQTSSEFILPSGTYNVYIKDLNNCSISQNDITVTDPGLISYSETVNDVTCKDNLDGSIEIVDVSNGSPPFEYSVDAGLTYSSSSLFTGLSAGTYDLVVKDNNGCISTKSIGLNEPDYITGIIDETAILCDNDSNGALEAIPSGGSGNYTYTWSNGENTASVTGLSAGSYNLTIKDSNGCESSIIEYILSEPEEILLTTIDVHINGYSVSCNGLEDGSAEVLVTGGTITSDYKYLWSEGSATSILDNVSAGSYTVEVIDDNDCKATASVEITEPPAIAIDSLLISDVQCNGGNDGVLSINVLGGVGGYLYSLNGSVGQIENEFDNLSAGDYSIVISDLNNCTDTTTYSISEPITINIILDSLINTNCGQSNGAIDLSITGGVEVYQFEWYDSDDILIGTEEDIDNLSGGSYTLKLTDGNGCLEQINTSISDTDGPSIIIEEVNAVSCYDVSDGSAKISISGGSIPYVIEWQDGQNEPIATNLPSGLANVQVTDDSNCISFVDIDIPAPPTISIEEIQLTNPLCYGEATGAITIYATGGTGILYYNWIGGIVDQTIEDLEAGEYQIEIIDENSCTYEEIITLEQPDSISVNYEITPPSCSQSADGAVLLNIVGGTLPYNIYIEDSIQDSYYINSLATGIYDLTISDQNSCVKNLIIEIPEVAPLEIAFEDIVLCEGQSLQLSSPINAEYYNWYLDTAIIGTNKEIKIDTEGYYSLELITNKGCYGQGTFNVTLSNDILIGDFLMSSYASIGDTIIVIDITHPVPDSINWMIPGDVEIITATNDFLMIVLHEAGVFEIGYNVYLGLCEDSYSAEIEILGDPDDPVGGRVNQSESNIVLLEVYPNPNNGRFNVKGFFSETSEVMLQVVSLSLNSVIIEKQVTVEDEQLWEFNLYDYPSGLYALVVRSNEQTKIIKILKN